MATVGELDFRSYVDSKKAKHATESEGRDDAHAYAYVSDRNTRNAFKKGRAVEYAVSHAVRLFRTVGKNELLGSTVKVCLLYTSPSPRDQRGSRMPSSA